MHRLDPTVELIGPQAPIQFLTKTSFNHTTTVHKLPVAIIDCSQLCHSMVARLPQDLVNIAPVKNGMKLCLVRDRIENLLFAVVGISSLKVITCLDKVARWIGVR